MWLSRGPTITGRQLEIILGHFVAACMFNRCGLSCLRAVYDFVRDAYLAPTKLWPPCRYDRWIMGSLVMLLSSDLDRPWAEEIVASDAAVSVRGVCRLDASLSEVADAEGWQERWRFKRLPPEQWAP